MSDETTAITPNAVRERAKRRMEAEGIPVGTDDPTLLALRAKPLNAPHVHECACGVRWDENATDVDGERARRQVEFLEILADGGGITVNGVPWREMFDRLNAIVCDGLPSEESDRG